MIEAGTPRAARPAPGRVVIFHPLTGREAQVFALLDRGLKDREIALQLQISVRTVEKHVENILRKLRARSRQEAVYRRPPLP